MSESILDVIKSRSSVRAFLPDPISRKTLEELLECAIWAPTGGSVQAWCFGIVNDKKMLKDIQTFAPGLFGNPPVIVVTCIDEERAVKRAGAAGADVLARIDVALASENLMLAAHAIGLGTCVVRSFNISAVSELLNLPSGMRIETLISLGKPAKPLAKGTRRPLKEVSFYNDWKEACI